MRKYVALRNRPGTISFLFEKKSIIVITALICLLIILFVVGLSIGSTIIHPATAIKDLLNIGDGEHVFTIKTLRLPRIILALLVGSALGVSGVILQGIIRNPLGAPNIVGITGGASFMAVIFISYFADTLGMKWLPLAAIMGAVIVSIIIYILSWKEGVSPIRLVLIGIGVSAAMNALKTMVIVIDNTYSTSQAYLWLVGSIYGANWQHVYYMLASVLFFIPLSLIFSKTANAQELGDSVAVGLGVKVQLHRFGMLFISVVLAGSAIAFAGGIGFVGLIAPHISRKLVGRSFGSLVPVAALVGGLIVFLADIVARTAFLPLDLPAGIFVSGIGAPFFIYLLYRERH